jgi:hypothetical protein
MKNSAKWHSVKGGRKWTSGEGTVAFEWPDFRAKKRGGNLERSEPLDYSKVPQLRLKSEQEASKNPRVRAKLSKPNRGEVAERLKAAVC